MAKKRTKVEHRYVGESYVLVLVDGKPASIIAPARLADYEDVRDEVATRYGARLECNVDKYPPRAVRGSGGKQVEFRVWLNESY